MKRLLKNKSLFDGIDNISLISIVPFSKFDNSEVSTLPIMGSEDFYEDSDNEEKKSYLRLN